MAWSLPPNEAVKVRYSKTERELFKLLPPGGGRIDSIELTAKHYSGEAPFHGKTIVVGLINSLMRKLEANGEPFRICKTGLSGPKPIEFWLQKEDAK
jgi:hypothetical protein